jgi:CheY-like chemotaxis protein/two-component sensor histidine kinase
MFSRGAEDEDRQAVDVRSALESSISMANNEIRHRALLVRELGEVPPVEANEARLGQVFLNLLLNAAQAIPDGASESNRVVVRTREEGAMVVVEVADTGVGIAPEQMQRLCEPFFTTKPLGMGTGLGLSVCHGIVKNLGGALEFESAPGKGTTVRVRLPRSAQKASQPRGAGAAIRVRRSGRVLVIDDEPRILQIVERTLRRYHEVVIERDARDALARIERGERFDAIVCDVMMPNMTGMDFHAAVPVPIAARIVFLTGGAFTDRTRAFLERIENVRLEKPFAAGDLLAAIDSRLQ